jgi:hypothetical protein
MDREAAAIIHTADDLARWAAKAVVETDALIQVTKVRPLSPQEQNANLLMQREMLVRMSQQSSILDWAVESRAARRARAARPGWWARVRAWARRKFLT